MDPNTALEDIRAAIHDGDDEEAANLFTDLDVWLSKGGFPPAEWTGNFRTAKRP